VRAENTALKRVGRDPRARRRSPDGRTTGKGLADEAGNCALYSKPKVGQRTQQGRVGPVSAPVASGRGGSVRNRTVSTLTVGGTSQAAAHTPRRMVVSGKHNVLGSVKQKNHVESRSVGSFGRDMPRGSSSTRGVWR
jgi:hypothetical protein